jgi:hypothetical protein
VAEQGHGKAGVRDGYLESPQYTCDAEAAEFTDRSCRWRLSHNLHRNLAGRSCGAPHR